MRRALPPGPALSPEEQTFLWFSKTYSFLDACARDLGPVFTLEFKGLGTHVFFSDPAAVEEIFTTDPGVFRAGEGNAFIRPFLRERSLLTLDGETYTRHRKMILPAFQPQKVSAHAARMREIAEEGIAGWRAGEPFAAQGALLPLTLDVILRAIFGAGNPVLGPMRGRLAHLLDAVSFTPLAAAEGTSESARAWEAFREGVAELDALLKQAIAAEKGGQSAHPPDSVLAILVGARDEAGAGLSDEDLRDEIVTLILAGHETTATSLAWALHWILGEPRVDSSLRREIEAAPEDPGAWLSLPYLDAVVKETLRITPVIPFVSWKVARDAIVAGVELPAGTHVVPCTYLTQRRPDLYPEPDRFRPERFLERKFTPYEYYPFGGGVRRCIGMGFGVVEMKVILAVLFRRLSLALEKGAEPTRYVRRSVVVAPAGGTRIVVYFKKSP